MSHKFGFILIVYGGKEGIKTFAGAVCIQRCSHLQKMIKNGTSAPANPICGRFITHDGVLITLGPDNPPPPETGAQVSRHPLGASGLLIHIAINAVFDPRNWV